MSFETPAERDALADNRTAMWNHGHGIWEHGEVPQMDEIPRYGFVVERDPDGTFVRAYAAPWHGSQEPGNDWVTFADHEADKQAALAEKDRIINALDNDRALANARVRNLEGWNQAKDRQISALTVERDRLRDAMNLILHGKIYTQDPERTEIEIEQIIKQALTPQSPAAGKEQQT